MAKKQYLDLAGLEVYDEQIKAHISNVAENNVFYITVTDDGEGNFSADKTLTQLEEARNNGKVLFCRLTYDEIPIILPIIVDQMLPEVALFSAQLDDVSLIVNMMLDGTVSVIAHEVANLDEIPTLISQLENDSRFITNSVNNLTNYYNKTNIDNKDAETLASAKSYIDNNLTNYYNKTNIDNKDAATLASAKTYTDQTVAQKSSVQIITWGVDD